MSNEKPPKVELEQGKVVFGEWLVTCDGHILFSGTNEEAERAWVQFNWLRWRLLKEKDGD